MTKQPKEPHIVLLHGWGSNPSRWDEVKKHIRSGKVFVPYIPGFDPQKPLKKPFTMDDYSKWLETYIDSNSIKNPVIIGHSNGGRIATHYTTQHKDVSKLILIGSAGIINTKLLFLLKKSVFKKLSAVGKNILRSRTTSGFAEKILYRLAGESDYQRSSLVMKQTMQNMLEYDIEKDLLTVLCPTLCIWGTRDRSTPLWMGKKIHSFLPDSKMVVLDGSHHLHRETPDKLAGVIDSFVSL